MANRIDRNPTRNAHAANVPNRSYLATSQSFDNPKFVDEVIAHLANLRENRRARQAGEWERLQRHAFRVTA